MEIKTRLEGTIIPEGLSYDPTCPTKSGWIDVYYRKGEIFIFHLEINEQTNQICITLTNLQNDERQNVRLSI
jgi:hypothetical protein